MVLFYCRLFYYPKSSLIIMILSGDRRSIFVCGGLTAQLFNSISLSPHHRHRHPTLKLCNHPVLFFRTNNATIKSSGNLLTSVRFCHSCLRSTKFWTGDLFNISNRSGGFTTVSFTTIKTTSFLIPLKLIRFLQINPSIFCSLFHLLTLFLKLSSNILPSIFPFLRTLPYCFSLIRNKYNSLL